MIASKKLFFKSSVLNTLDNSCIFNPPLESISEKFSGPALDKSCFSKSLFPELIIDLKNESSSFGASLPSIGPLLENFKASVVKDRTLWLSLVFSSRIACWPARLDSEANLDTSPGLDVLTLDNKSCMVDANFSICLGSAFGSL